MNEFEAIFQKSPVSASWNREDILKLPNRATSYGDGLFETMIWDYTYIRFFDVHLRRLMHGMHVLGLDETMINPEELISLLESNTTHERKRLRWSVFRAGPGKYSPESSEVIQLLEITAFHAAPMLKKKVDFSLKIQLFPTLWASFKSLNSLPYVLANQERKERGLDEIVLLDYRGYIAEAGSSTIFWVKEDIIYTPSLSCSCIDGVSRRIILAHLDRISQPYVEGEFKLAELQDASHAFVSNCTGISYLEDFGSKKFSTTPLSFLEQIFD